MGTTMTLAPSIVHVIVAPDYGERLRDLPSNEAAWVADTSTNHPVIKSILATHSVKPYPDYLTGITSFKVPADKTPEDWLLGVLGPIEDHHCWYSQTPPYSTLRVIGTVLTLRIRERFESYDFVRFEDLPEGFVAHKLVGLPGSETTLG
jgi:hypothetical protein